LTFQVRATDGAARRGAVTLAHGTVETPAFMPVGTAGVVKALTPRDLRELGAQMVLANTYHLMLRPGEDLVARLGGLQRFSGWHGPMLTDSGGYQVFSLSALRRLNEDGVEFQSHLDGSRHLLSPERSMDVQRSLGADIVMAFDECAPWPAPREAVEQAMQRTTRWARRSQDAFARGDDGRQWLFGIVQGGVEDDLRRQSAQELVAMGFSGYAVGGLSVGEPKPDMLRVLDTLEPLLPADRPRYLMGVGTPEDLLEGVARGIDLFDCVLPTRNGRNGQLFTRGGRLTIRNARYRDDPRPPEEGCACYTCRTVSRAYLRHLHLSNEITGATLMTLHNVHHYLDTLRRMRQSILLGRFAEFRQETLRALSAPARDEEA